MAAPVAAVLALAIAFVPDWSSRGKAAPSLVRDGAVDHSAWDDLVRTHVRDGAVDYATLKTKGPREKLSAYLGGLAAVSVGELRSKEERLAFWLNAYNACVVDKVLRSYPISSPMGVQGFFGKDGCAVAGEPRTLDQIDRTILQGEFREPLARFAMTLGSRSSPPLAPFAFRGDSLATQLNERATAFVRGEGRPFVDVAAKTAHVNRTFQWLESDVKTLLKKSLVEFIAERSSADVAKQLTTPGLRVVWSSYDWGLNRKP